MAQPLYRPRRLRESPLLRRMVRETRLGVENLILPLFAVHGRGVRDPVASMPGVSRLSLDELLKEAKDAASMGIPAVLLFGVPQSKDPRGSEAYAEDGIVQQAARAVKETIPDLLVITDVCLCQYTSHGHCGARRGRPRQERRERGAPGPRRAVPHGVRGRHRRALRHDGRPRGSDPGGARRGGLHRDADHGVLGEVRLGVLRAVPGGGGVDAPVRGPALLPDGSGERRRGAARGGARRRRGRGHRDGEAGPPVPGRDRPGAPGVRAAPGRVLGLGGVRDDQGRRAARLARRGARACWRRSRRSGAPARISIITYFAREAARLLERQRFASSL